MATIHVDGKDFEVDGADNLLRACLSLGLDIPYFCWHPALGSVGACRQCAVKQYNDENDTRGRIVMSCMTPATDGAFISIEDEEAKVFRASVVEWLMINHPHDCPVCEEGGHCHLQDMTVMTGHNSRRYRFTKRTHQNQDLGPFVSHEMNRCIACYRCVRYYKDYAGGTDLGVYGAHDNVYFGRIADGVLESEFSGNLVEVCPTGVFTDKTHSERYNRKWDMQFAPSICQQCSVGCNTSPGERYGELRRIENRYNGSVNHYFLCDRGRFGYGYVNRKDRPREPYLRRQGEDKNLSIDDALDTTLAILKNAKRVIGIGSPRASLETNFALRELVGEQHFFSGMNEADLRLTRLAFELLAHSPATIPALREIEDKDAVLILGEDLTQTAPRMAMAVRQSVRGKAAALAAEKKIPDWHAEAIANIGQHEKNPLFIACVDATKLDDAATLNYRSTPDDIARAGFAVAHAIDAEAPTINGVQNEMDQWASAVAASLLGASSPVIIAGTSLMNEACLHAAANIVIALHKKGKNCALSLVVQEVNSLGCAMMGGHSLDAALAKLSSGESDVVVIAENDLYRRLDRKVVDAALAAAKTVVVMDHQATATIKKAHIVFPSASFAEASGTVVNQEGRAQRFFDVYDPVYTDPTCKIKDGWRWLHALHSSLHGQPFLWTQLDEATAACAKAHLSLAKVVDAAPQASFRMLSGKVARQPHRYSGRTAMRANISVHEPRASVDKDSALNFSMEGYRGTQAPAALTPFAWAPGWNSPQAWNKFQDEVGGHLHHGDPGVRLIAPSGKLTAYFECELPAPAAIKTDERLCVPLYHLFGSEELSSLSAPVESHIPEPYVALCSADIALFGFSEGEKIEVTLGSHALRLPVTAHKYLAVGAVGIPVGLPGMPVVNFGVFAQLRKVAHV